MERMVDQDGSWIKIILKSDLTSRMVLTMRLFFQTFYEKILMSFKIMLCYCLQLNELKSFDFLEFSYIL